jgi:hypothetical protein
MEEGTAALVFKHAATGFHICYEIVCTVAVNAY